MKPVIQRASSWLVEQHLKRLAFTDFPSDCVPASVEQAYQIQDAFVVQKSLQCGSTVGWKIALSNPTMQQFVGLREPVAGRLHSKQVVGTSAITRAADYGRLLIEFEIAVELGADLAPQATAYTREQVSNAVAALRPAYELADDRGADYATLNRHGLQMVADNAWNEGAVLGERRSDWRSLDLSALVGSATLNGEAIGTGKGSDLMGHPLDALAWLATHASRRGVTMRAGEIAILGTLITSKFPQAGQTFEYTLNGFAPLCLTII